MIQYKKSLTNNMKQRRIKELNVVIEDKLEFTIPPLNTARDKVRYIKRVESVIRKSMEYKTYIKFLKDNLDFNRCTVLQNLKSGEGKRYRIEIHHEPFTLFDIVSAILNKRIEKNESLHELDIADEAMALHYDEKVGLIPLSITMHEAVHSDTIFIPLNLIYHRYDLFFDEYEPYFDSTLLHKIEAKAKLSEDHHMVASNMLEPCFVYINVDNFNFPEIPEEWKDIMKVNISED